jgi:hypothetical protein
MFTTVKSWSVMTDFWFDIPLRSLDTPISHFFGRTPRGLRNAIEPMSLYMGVGVGASFLKIDASSNEFTVLENPTKFAWQVGTGIGYSLTEYVTLSVGYRYFDQQDVTATLRFQANDSGTYTLQQSVNEFRSALRVDLYSFPNPWLLMR